MYSDKRIDYAREKMKILHIVPSYLPAYRYGGPIESVHALNKALVAANAEVTVFTTNKNGDETLKVPLNQPVSVDGVQVWYFPVSFPQNWFYSVVMRKALKEHVKNFDIIHITSIWLAASTLGAYYAKRFKKPYIISPRGSFMQNPLQRKSLKKKMYLWLIEKRNLTGASALHFTTEQEAADYLKKFPRTHSFVVPNIISAPASASGKFSLRETFKIEKDEKIILSLGRLHPIKGFDTLIPAFAEVIKKIPNTTLVVAGESEGGYQIEIEKLTQAFHVEGKVVFTGMLGGEKKEAALRESNIFVLPSYSENFGMAVGGAMQASLPVVVTDAVGISDVVARTESGRVIQKDVTACADAITEILGNSKMAKRFGENGRRAVAENFSPQRVAERMLREYNEIIKNKLHNERSAVLT